MMILTLVKRWTLRKTPVLSSHTVKITKMGSHLYHLHLLRHRQLLHLLRHHHHHHHHLQYPLLICHLAGHVPAVQEEDKPEVLTGEEDVAEEQEAADEAEEDELLVVEESEVVEEEYMAIAEMELALQQNRRSQKRLSQKKVVKQLYMQQFSVSAKYLPLCTESTLKWKQYIATDTPPEQFPFAAQPGRQTSLTADGRPVEFFELLYYIKSTL